MNNWGTGAKKFIVTLPRDCHACALNDKVFRLRPKRKPIRSVLINGLCNFEDVTRAATAASKSSVGLTSHTSPIAMIAINCNRLPFGLCVSFPTRQKLRFHLSYSRTSSLVFDVREPLCVRYENAWRSVA